MTKSANYIELDSEFITPYLQIGLDEFKINKNNNKLIDYVLNYCRTNLNPYSAIKEDKNVDLALLDALIQKKTSVAIGLINVAQGLISYKSAESLLSFSDSYCRMYLLVNLHGRVSHDDWMKLFFKSWESCDGCTIYSEELICIFEDYDLNEVREKYFTKKQKAEFANLPDQITVYRGSLKSENINLGLSWTFEENIADQFAQSALSFIRHDSMFFRMLTNMLTSEFKKIIDLNAQESCILKMTVNKSDVLLFGNRGESEVLIPKQYHIDNAEIIKVFER